MADDKFQSIQTFTGWAKHIIANNYAMAIPDYQRAYAWGEENAKSLFDDLNNNDNYFLGLFLLEDATEKDRKYFIIDGQQRFTTLFMLLFVLENKFKGLSLGNDLSVREYLYYSQEYGMLRLALQEGQNEIFFKEILSKEILSEENSIEALDKKSQNTEYKSQTNIINVLKYFLEAFKNIEQQQAKELLRIIGESKILLYSASDSGEAMQIFELLNDRGKSLTQLEALKSFVMHKVYVKSGDDLHIKQDNLKPIKKHFSEIYATLNKIHAYEKNISEDDILRYHFIAFEEWSGKDYQTNVKDNLKRIYSVLNPEQLENKINGIKKSFEFIYQIIEAANKGEKKWLKNLYLLDRMATFYPLLIAIQKENEENLELVCNYLELFTYRAFGIMNKRTSTKLGALYYLANDLGNKRENIETIIERMKNHIREAVGIRESEKFENFLADKQFYHSQKGIDGKYILIKYENKKRDKAQETIYLSDINKISGKVQKHSFSVEHIVPQSLADENDKEDEKTIRYITQGEAQSYLTKHWDNNNYKKLKKNYFKDNFLNSLGNLVIATHSGNSSKSNDLPWGRKKKWETFKSQIEVGEMIKENQRMEGWKKNYPFTIDEIEVRQKEIIEFAKEYWSHSYLEAGEDETIKSIEDRKPLI